MVNIKDYSEFEDFFNHKKEYDLFYENISKYTKLNSLQILDIGAGWGKHLGFNLNNGAKFVLGVDVSDYKGYFGKDYKNKLTEYYKKYDCPIVSDSFALMKMDGQKLALKNSSFDIIFCMNVFEHIPSPERTFLEIHRVLKPGGYVFISFLPSYYSDLGSHMIDFINEPWAHLKYSEEEYIDMLRKATPGTEYYVNEFKYHLNRLPRKYFVQMYNKYTDANIPLNNSKIHFISKVLSLIKPDCKLFHAIKVFEWNGVEHKEYLTHENFIKLQKKYSKEDLLFRGMYVLLRKN